MSQTFYNYHKQQFGADVSLNGTTALTGTTLLSGPTQLNGLTTTGAININGSAAFTSSLSGTGWNIGNTGNIILNNASTQISSSSVVGISGEIVNISGGVINIGRGNVRVGTGNVGIGTTSPNALLQFVNDVSNRKIVLYERNNNDHEYYGFGINSGMLRYQIDSLGDACHAFWAGNGASSSNELMRIKGNGNVGIGTTNPGYTLDVSGTANFRGSVPSLSYITTKTYTFAANSSGQSNAQFIGSCFGGVVDLYINDTGTGHNGGAHIRICCGAYNATPVMQIIQSGFNGAPNSTLNYVLYYSLSGNTTSLWFNQTNGSSSVKLYECRIYCSNPGVFSLVSNGTSVNAATQITNGMVINGNGNVGIGTGSPASILEIASIGDPVIRVSTLSGYQNNHYTGIEFYSPGFPMAAIRGLDKSSSSNGIFNSQLSFHTNHSNVLNEQMRIDNLGRVGIGFSDNIDYKLKVNGSIFGSSVYAGSTLLTSDKRIKTNILDIDDSKALSILRKIQPKTYDYIDVKERGKYNVIGFIAQEIEEIIPNAITLANKVVPNFYTNCQIAPTDVSNIVLVTSPIDLSWNPLHGSANASGSAGSANASDACGNAFVDADGNACSDASGNKVFKIQLKDLSDNEINCKTTNVLDKRSFLMDVNGSKIVDGSGNLVLENNGEYFLYGQEVDDFHYLDKSYVYTVVTAAVQDIDRKQVLDEAKIAALESKNATLEAQVASLQSQMAAVLSKLSM